MLDPWFKHHYPLKHLKKWLYWPWADYRVTRDAQAVLFTAEEERRLARESFWLYKVREAVVGYGLGLNPDAQAAQADDFLQAFPQARGARIVLFLGRLHVKKGCDMLVDAFADVAERDPSLLLVMAGPDQTGLRPALERRAASLGVAQRIVWTGMLQGRAKWGALRAAEVFVLPSHQENFGIAVAEALAVGVPVLVSTKVNIWREIVGAGAGLAEPDTPEGTRRLLRRWTDLGGDERAAYAAGAAPCFEANFHIDSAARRLTETLDAEVAAARGAGPQPRPA
jgi:glycosyltransferase involved in cell wall biosynthesis